MSNIGHQAKIAIHFVSAGLLAVLTGCGAVDSPDLESTDVDPSVASEISAEAADLDPSFATDDEATAVGIAALVARSCKWVRIYQHVNFRGRDLRFSERRCHNLTDWDFNDAMSSYKTGPCSVRFYEHINCRGASFHASSSVSNTRVPQGWNDRVSSLRIE
jgi:hypothetical protein